MTYGPHDPRPAVVIQDGQARLAGRRCRACAYPLAYPWPRCPVCHGELAAEHFGPRGTVWAATVVRIPVSGRTPPYRLAYVDLDDGPRVLAHLAGTLAGQQAEPVAIGSRVRLARRSATGDIEVEVADR